MAGAKDGLEADTIIPGSEEQDEAPKDVRSAINAAVKEHSEDGDDDESRVSVAREPRGTSNKRSKSVSDVDKEETEKRELESKEKEDSEESLSSEEGKEKKEVKEEPAIEAPPFFKVKGKATWDKLSPEDKKVILSREEEVSNGFKQFSQRIKGVEEIERAIAPRLQQIQQYGVSPGVVVDRLFGWMEGLNDPKRKLSTFKELASSFGVNINQLVSNGQATEETPDPDAPPTWFNEFTSTVEGKIGTLEQQLTAQREASTESYILNWAKDKPHYNTVSQLMGQLLQSGAVPALNASGAVNLDGAYEMAIKVNPEVSALIQQEANQKIAAEASQKALKDAKDKADRLARARKAGAGLKPAAPSLPAGNLNGKGKEDNSIRASIRKSIEELRD